MDRGRIIAVPPLVHRPLAGYGLKRSLWGSLRCIGRRPAEPTVRLAGAVRSAARGGIHSAALTPFHQPGVLLAGLDAVTSSRHRVVCDPFVKRKDIATRPAIRRITGSIAANLYFVNGENRAILL